MSDADVIWSTNQLSSASLYKTSILAYCLTAINFTIVAPIFTLDMSFGEGTFHSAYNAAFLLLISKVKLMSFRNKRYKLQFKLGKKLLSSQGWYLKILHESWLFSIFPEKFPIYWICFTSFFWFLYCENRRCTKTPHQKWKNFCFHWKGRYWFLGHEKWNKTREALVLTESCSRDWTQSLRIGESVSSENFF